VKSACDTCGQVCTSTDCVELRKVGDTLAFGVYCSAMCLLKGTILYLELADDAEAQVHHIAVNFNPN